MFFLILFTILISVAVPVLTTWAYRRWLSPMRKYQGLINVPGGKMALFICCAILPLIGAAVFNFVENRIDMDTWWWLIFGLAIITCSIAMDGIISLSYRKKRLIILALPYLLIAAFSTAAAMMMIALTIDGPQRLW